jgi:hypothetical protein
MKRILLMLTTCLLISGYAYSQISVSGAVTVNGTYTSLTNASGAFAAINGTAQTGANIVITINSDVLTEAGTNSLNAGAWTSITINPSGARTISGAPTAGTPLINFNGADNVTVNGLNTEGNSLTISNTQVSSSSGTSTIKFIADATNNTITNCTVLGSANMAVGTNGGVIFFSTGTTTGNDNNTISYCNIGPAGSNLPSKTIYGNGSTTSTAIGNSGITITENNIYDYFGAAVTSAGIYTGGGCNTWTITNNKFYQTGTRTWTSGFQNSAIWLTPSTATSGAQGFTITGNTIGYASSSATGTYSLTGSTGKFIGIYFNGITGGTVSQINTNTINAVSVTGVTSSGTGSSSPLTGMYIANGLVNTNSNTIGSQSLTGTMVLSTTTTSATDVYGIYNFSSDDWTANSNNIGGYSITNAGASGTFLFYGLRANTSTSKVFNVASNNIGGTVANSIQLNATGTSSQLIGIYTSNAATTATSNTIRNLSTNIGTGTGSTSSLIGIGISASSTNHTVSQNTIYNLSNTNASAASYISGINFNSSTGTNLINRNFIHSLSIASSSSSATMYGINIIGGTATYQNNMIRLGIDGSGNSLTNGIIINGIYEGVGTDNIYFNSIYIGGSGVTGTASSYAFNSAVTVNTRNYKNNIMVNARSNSSGTGKHYAVKVAGTSANPTGLSINNNDYFVSGTGGVFGYFNALDVANLAAWKTAVGQDANSWEMDPQFLTPAGTSSTADLHISTEIATIIEGKGVNIPSVTTDYDGQTRSTLTPEDIGADALDAIAVIPCTGTPDASAIEGADVCYNTGTSLTLSPVYDKIGITYQWKYSTTSGGPYTNSGTSSSQSTGNLTTTTYYVCEITCTNSSETFTTDEFTVVVKPIPTSGASSNTPICAGETLELTGTTDIGTTFAWTGPDSFTSTTQNPEIASATTAATGSYSFVATLNGCSSTAASTSVVVNATPTEITITPAAPSVSYNTVNQLLASGGLLPGQSILTENFNEATNNWTTINNSTGGVPADAAWTLRPNGYSYSSPAVVFNSNDNSQFYLTNSDDQGSSSITSTILQSPAFSTIDFTAVNVSFYHYFRRFDADAVPKVDYSLDGTSWTNIKTYIAAAGASGGFVLDNIALPAGALDKTTVYIRFKFDDIWGYYWAIDNVSISGTGPGPITWSPTTDLYTDVDALIAYTGDARATVYTKPQATRTYTATGASDLGCTNSTDVIVSLYPAVSFTLTGPSSVTAGSNSTDFTIQVYDVLDNPTVCTGNTCFALTTNSTGQDAGFSNNAPCIAADAGSTTFTYMDSKFGTFNLTATFGSGDAGLTGQSETAPITVNILPWLQANISAANGSTESFPAINAGTFEITATGISAPKVDVHNFVYQQLCGTGTVIAHLSDLENGGWAGVEMRESNAPGAKTILIKTKLFSPSVLIGYRTATNGNMSNLGQTIPSLKWMKIQRNGNTFTVYISYNGTAWVKRYGATISMANCINAGFFTENTKINQFVTSTFDNAEVVNYLKSGEETELEVVNKDAFDIEFYPNPASDQITIVAPDNTSNIRVSVINASGMVVESDLFNTTDAIYNLQQLKPGVYLIRFEREGILVNKRLVIF